MQHTLVGMGYVETNSSAYTLFDHISNLVANYLHDLSAAPERAKAFEAMVDHDRPDLSGGIDFVPTPRHRFYADSYALRKSLARVTSEMGWEPLRPGMF